MYKLGLQSWMESHKDKTNSKPQKFDPDTKSESIQDHVHIINHDLSNNIPILTVEI